MSRKILYIGAHGKVGLLALPKLKDAGFAVTALVRNPDYEADLLELGAVDVEIRDIVEQSPSQWAELFDGYTAVVWAAGNGGRAGADQTTAIDRDGELAVIAALESMKNPPRYITVNYFGWDLARVEGDPTKDSWQAYVDAKKTVGARLSVAPFDHVILAPSVLTDEPSRGGRSVGNHDQIENPTTSRELVAETIVAQALKPTQTSGTYAFIDA